MNKTKLCIRASLVALMLLMSACSDSGDDRSGETAPSGMKSSSDKPISSERKESTHEEALPFKFVRSTADIVGIRLGMTTEEAEAALRAHDSESKIQIRRSALAYSAGREQRQADEYISAIHATLSKHNPQFTDGTSVFFLPPPNDNLVAQVNRNTSWHYSKEGPAAVTYHDAVVEKYGKPDAEIINPQGVEFGFDSAWYLSPKRADCPTPKEIRSKFNPYGGGILIQPGSDLPSCGGLLYVRVIATQGVVQTAHAILKDVAGSVKGGADTATYLNELTEKAMKELLKDAEKPTL